MSNMELWETAKQSAHGRRLEVVGQVGTIDPHRRLGVDDEGAAQRLEAWVEDVLDRRHVPQRVDVVVVRLEI